MGLFLIRRIGSGAWQRQPEAPISYDPRCKTYREEEGFSTGGMLDARRTSWHRHPMDDLLRFPSAVRRDPQIEAWFSSTPDPFRLMTRTWFERMRGCGADVRELLHDGCPVACVGDAPFGYVNAFKAHANVGFYYGAMLADPTGLLEGEGKRMRHVKLRPGKELDIEALSDLVVAAYHDIRRRLTQANLR